MGLGNVRYSRLQRTRLSSHPRGAARFEAMNSLVSYLTDHCGQGRPELCAASDRLILTLVSIEYDNHRSLQRAVDGTATWRELYELYRLTCPPANIEPHYNIAPTTMIDVVVPYEAGRDLMAVRWGLIPSWWKKTAEEVKSTFAATSARL